MNEDFDSIVAGLDLDETPDVTDVTQLTQLELLTEFQQARHRLETLHESLGQPVGGTTGQDHSRYQALVAELKRRGLM